MAIKFYSLKDRIPVKIGELTFKLAPLSKAQKIELQMHFLSNDKKEMLEGSLKAIQFSVKSVEGIINAVTGEEFELDFDDNGIMTEDSLSDLINAFADVRLQSACANLINGIPETFIDLMTGEKLDGVKIIEPKKKGKKK